MPNNKLSKSYLVGGGIASLASAAYLIKDGHIPGENIYILEELNLAGGSMDGAGSAEKGYSTRGGRMFTEDAYTCTYDLLSFIPSLSDPQITLKEELFAFKKKVQWNAKSRLVADGKKVDASNFGLSLRDKFDLMKIIIMSESFFGASRIKDHFSPLFFASNFWFMWCTTFAFEPWHSAVEFKRYVLRFIQEFPRINTLTGIRRTPYNQYESIILPLTKWLKEQNVNFKMNCQVTDLDFDLSENEKTIKGIYYICEGKESQIIVNNNDYVFVTVGSMTADSSLGSMTAAPILNTNKLDGSWKLWENISKKHPDFGRPSVFSEHIDESHWESFTVTLRDPAFFEMMKNFTGNETGTGGLVTIKDSNWLMTVVLPNQPHFMNQPKDINICWGYGLFPERVGNYVPKKMSECTGEEILVELFSHLGFTKDIPSLIKTANCIPCMMPYITSQFLPREKGDRPLVVPKGSTNLAFIGQYCEIPDDVVFTVEYSVRSAQTSVYSLLKLDEKVSPIYKGLDHVSVLVEVMKTLLK
jgi:oleate hydratase